MVNSRSENIKTKTLVSIVMPCFNKAEYVLDSIQSIFSQTYTNWELIIVDDGSKDESVRLAKQIISNNKKVILVENKTNLGANFCRNKGLSIATGEFVMFVDADDLLSSNCLAGRVKYMRNNELDFAVFEMQVFHKQPEDDKRLWKPNSKNPLKDFLTHDLPWQTMQPIWRREFVSQMNGFDETFDRLQDVEFHTRVLILKPQYQVIENQVDCYYRINKFFKSKDDLFKLKEKVVLSTLKYYRKFVYHFELIDSTKLLNGTIYQIYLQIIFEYRHQQITKEQFRILEQKLLNNEMKAILGLHNLQLFRFSKYYNLYFPRISGINRLIKHILIS